MNRRVRRKLEMAVRVREFSRAHPSADANYATVLGRMEELITRMQGMSGQQQGGYLTRHSSVVRRQELRRKLHSGLLRHLVTVADVAAEENPALVGMFRMPSVNATHEAYRTLARKMLEQGQAQKELLATHGLADKLLEDLTAAVDEFDASVDATNDGLLDHVSARAELQAASDEVVRLVGMLDGLNRYRFDREPQLLAAWESARHVVTEAGADVSVEGPASGEVKPAA